MVGGCYIDSGLLFGVLCDGISVVGVVMLMLMFMFDGIEVVDFDKYYVF